MATANSSHSFVLVFDIFELLAVLLISCTLLTAICCRAIQRSIAWYNLITGWLVYSLSYGLLVGRQEGPQPPMGLCVLQTVLVYAVPGLWVSTHSLSITTQLRQGGKRHGLLLYWSVCFQLELRRLAAELIFKFYLIISGLKSGNPRPPSSLRTFFVGITFCHLFQHYNTTLACCCAMAGLPDSSYWSFTGMRDFNYCSLASILIFSRS
jgi:hypothetical protein